jgi:hypothetical protein
MVLKRKGRRGRQPDKQTTTQTDERTNREPDKHTIEQPNNQEKEENQVYIADRFYVKTKISVDL